MTEQKKATTCSRCDSVLSGKYCSNCGQPQQLRRINGQYVLSEIGSVLNFDKGILFTIRELVLRPGSSIRTFIAEDRGRLMKPILFIIVCSLIYTLVQQLFDFEDGYVNFDFGEASTASSIFTWMSKNYGYANLLMAVFIAFWIRLFFRKHPYNYFEILILLCFVIGMGMLIFSLFGIVDSFTDLKIVDKGFLLGVLYIAWAIGQFFTKNKIINFLKGFFSYLLGIASFTFLSMILGFLIDWIGK
jgi:hypothetical protein